MFIPSVGVLRELVAILIVPANLTAAPGCQTVWYLMKFMSRLWLSWVRGRKGIRTPQNLPIPGGPTVPGTRWLVTEGMEQNGVGQAEWG